MSEGVAVLNSELRLEAQKQLADRECLLVLLRPRLTLVKGLRWPLNGFAIGNRIYRNAGFGVWTSFYDWLRNKDSVLLGVRYWLSHGTEFLTKYTERLTYVKGDPTRNIEIYFSACRLPEAALSADQAFLYDAIFQSERGDYAIGFGMEELSDKDLKSLERADAEWSVASPQE